MDQPAKTVKLTNAPRIIRIFRKICQSKIQVLIRDLQNPSTAVKGRALTLQTVYHGDSKNVGIIICDVSSKGLRYLFDKETIQLEFVMVSSKIVCNCNILRIKDTELILSLPQALYSTEKRKSTRYKTHIEAPAFLKLSIWQSHEDDILAPPYFIQHSNIFETFPIVDLSFVGICFKTQFPSMIMSIEKGIIDSNAQILLPMSPSIPVELVVRWIKTIKEHVKLTSRESINIATFYVGCSFKLNQDDMTHRIRKYIQQIIEAKAI